MRGSAGVQRQVKDPPHAMPYVRPPGGRTHEGICGGAGAFPPPDSSSFSNRADWAERRESIDGGLCGQRVRAERGDGLSAGAGRRAAGGRSPPAGTVHTGGAGRRGLRRGGVSAGRRLSGCPAGKAGGGSGAGSAGLWRGGTAAPADAAALHRFQRHGGVCSGTGTAGRGRRSDGKRRFLHGCGRQSAADCRRRGLCCAGGGVPGVGKERHRRKAYACAGLRGRAGRGADGAVGYRQRPFGAGRRETGAGGGARRAGRRAAA